MDGEDYVGAVVLPGEQGLQPGGLHVGLQGGKALFQLGDETLVLKLVAHLAQGHQVVPLRPPLVLAVHLVLEVLDALLHLLGLGQVVPEAVGGGLSLEHIQLPPGPFQVQSLGQLLEGREQIVQLYLVFIKLEHIVPTLS